MALHWSYAPNQSRFINNSRDGILSQESNTETKQEINLKMMYTVAATFLILFIARVPTHTSSVEFPIFFYREG